MAADARRYGSPPGYTTHEHDETSHPDRHDRLGVADEQQRQRNSEAHLARVHARRCWAVRVLSVRLLAALMRRTVLPLELRCARSRANGVGPARNRGALGSGRGHEVDQRTTVIWISAAAAWEVQRLDGVPPRRSVSTVELCDREFQPVPATSVAALADEGNRLILPGDGLFERFSALVVRLEGGLVLSDALPFPAFPVRRQRHVLELLHVLLAAQIQIARKTECLPQGPHCLSLAD
jgi:hypothetical protein